MHEQVAFDEAIDVCLEFQQRVPDTLIVITPLVLVFLLFQRSFIASFTHSGLKG